MKQIVEVIFYLVLAVISLYSLLAIYSLLRFGRTKVITATVSMIYLFFLVSLYLAAVRNINQL